MKHTLMQQTTFIVYLIVQDDTGGLVVVLAWMTKLFTWLCHINQTITAFWSEGKTWVQDIQAAFAVAVTLVSICFISAAYGLGVRR